MGLRVRGASQSGPHLLKTGTRRRLVHSRRFGGGLNASCGSAEIIAEQAPATVLSIDVGVRVVDPLAL